MKFIRALLTAGAVLAPWVASAQSYPDKPVRMIVNFAPGGPSDVTARIVAFKLSEVLGKQFFVENHAGGGGNLGLQQAARATGDGYTVLLSSSVLWLNPVTYSKVPYDWQKDFIPISLVATTPNALVVHPSVPAKTVKELVELIQANPGKYPMANPGIGTPPHMSGELFRMALKLDMTQVPFNGGGPMIQSVVAGHTPIAFTSMPPAAPQIQGGKLRGLGVASSKRSAAVPDVPTMTEAGYPGQEGETPQGLFVPAGTPQPIVDTLHKALMRVLAMPDVKEKLGNAGLEVIGNTPAEFAVYMRAEAAKWAKVAKDANIKID